MVENNVGVLKTRKNRNQNSVFQYCNTFLQGTIIIHSLQITYLKYFPECKNEHAQITLQRQILKVVTLMKMSPSELNNLNFQIF